MIKYIILIFSFCYISTLSVFCQTTNYYKQTKFIENGKEYTSLSGGQFITIEDGSCFDSDINGRSVGNGRLNYYKEFSANHPTYIGNSYYGNVTYRFSSDYRTLNIIINKSIIYVYKMSTAPEGVVTSSLIKGSTSRPQGQFPWGSVGGIPPTYGGNYKNGNNNNSAQSGNSQSMTSSTTKNQPKRHTCPRCNGNKRIAIETHPPMFGQEDYKERCSECGGYYLHSWGHTHVTCPQCHGKGYFTTD